MGVGSYGALKYTAEKYFVVAPFKIELYGYTKAARKNPLHSGRRNEIFFSYFIISNNDIGHQTIKKVVDKRRHNSLKKRKAFKCENMIAFQNLLYTMYRMSKMKFEIRNKKSVTWRTSWM